MFDIAITIVNYKMAEEIRQLLESLKQDLVGSSLRVQVIVVDNTPDDGTWLMLKNIFPEAKYLPQDYNLGFGRAQNVGLAAAEAKYYFILNPDVVFEPGGRILEKMFQFMEANPRVGMAAPKLLNSDGTLQYSCFRFPFFWMPLFRRSSLGQRRGFSRRVNKFLMKEYNHEGERPVDWVMGSAMFARGEALQQVGNFDERYFMYFEDCDLCRRFWQAHWPIYYLGGIKIRHRLGKGSAKVPGFLRSMLKNQLTRIHISSWLKYMWKWRFTNI